MIKMEKRFVWIFLPWTWVQNGLIGLKKALYRISLKNTITYGFVMIYVKFVLLWVDVKEDLKMEKGFVSIWPPWKGSPERFQIFVQVTGVLPKTIDNSPKCINKLISHFYTQFISINWFWATFEPRFKLFIFVIFDVPKKE